MNEKLHKDQNLINTQPLANKHDLNDRLVFLPGRR